MGTTALRLGFIPLIDAAPLIAAQENGFFACEGLAVSLHRQIGWANVRDKLSFGHLDAAHALLGMPLASHMGRDSFSEPLVAVMGLGSGGNAITVRRDLFDSGIKSAADLARMHREQPAHGRLVVGHVFGSSMHHYLVREWLASGGLNPDSDTKLCVIPPAQMTEHMRGGYLDLFCVGEPWNTVAAREAVGATLVSTTDILPRHPEKVLAISHRFAAQAGGFAGATITSLVRAVLRGCLWCAELAASGRGKELAEMLAQPQYLAQPVDVLQESLSINRDFGASRIQKNARPGNWTARSFSPELSGGTFPNKMHAVWMLREMIRWGHLHPDANILEIADRCCDTTAYRAAATSLGVGCPDNDFVTMELRAGKTLRLEDVRGKRSIVRRAVPGVELKTETRSRPPARVA
ncbi:MAG TPA: CmpA/NrtA family ABC transporter substrate-binding protein [Phycisphaerae bacterium]|nr:CmpA/NrtA family ABC transporter substrate-binding protein [Phycisphaerae bacterium]